MAVNDEDVRELRQLLTENLRVTTEIHTVLFPAPGQPNAVQSLTHRVAKLEAWRSFLSGAWAVVTAIFSWHVVKGH